MHATATRDTVVVPVQPRRGAGWCGASDRWLPRLGLRARPSGLGRARGWLGSSVALCQRRRRAGLARAGLGHPARSLRSDRLARLPARNKTTCVVQCEWRRLWREGDGWAVARQQPIPALCWATSPSAVRDGAATAGRDGTKNSDPRRPVSLPLPFRGSGLARANAATATASASVSALAESFRFGSDRRVDESYVLPRVLCSVLCYCSVQFSVCAVNHDACCVAMMPEVAVQCLRAVRLAVAVAGVGLPLSG